MATLLAIGLTNAVLATLLALVVWCVTRVWRHPVLVAVLWTLVLVKLVTPPLITIQWQLDRNVVNTVVPQNRSAEQVGARATDTPLTQTKTDKLRLSERIATGTTEPITPPLETIRAHQFATTAGEPLDWTLLLTTVWLSGSAVWLLIAVGRLARFQRALQHTESCPDEVSGWANEVAAQLGVISRFRLRVTDARLSPFVWPIGRPTIVLSRSLLAEMSREETKMLLAHELAHVKRKDHWLRWLELTVTAIYWWHPVAWWARHMVHKAEEQACDAWVVWAFPESAKRYASALFKAVQMATEHRSRAPLVASRLGSTGHLKERIEDIMNATWSCRISNPARLALALLVLLVLPFSLRFAAAAGEQSSASNEKKPAVNHQTTVTTNSNDKHDAPPAAIQPINDAAKSTVSEPSPQSKVRIPSNPYRIAAGDVLHVAVSNAFSDQPIGDDYLVEPGGTIALGPAYGRANVAGMTLEDADRAVTKHLSQVIENPSVQVTIGGWRDKAGLKVGRHESISATSQDAHTPASGTGLERPISPEELVALREHVAFLKNQFTKVDSLYQTGSRGGSADARTLAGYELAVAECDLALAEGRVDVAFNHCQRAEQFAEDAVKSVGASYEAGRVSLQVLLEAARNLSESKRRLISIRDSRASVPSSRLPTPDVKSDLKRELTQRSSMSDANTSASVWKKFMDRAKQKYEHLKPLVDKKVVPADELEAAKTDYEVTVAQYEHAQRVLKYAQLEVQLAETELQEAASRPRTTGNATDDFELKKLKIKLEMAKVKASELE